MEYVDVTPEMAKEWVKKISPDKQRKLNQARCVEYAEQMKAGLWGLSTDAIGFSTDDNLINGQHRLYAIILSNTTQRFLVVRDLPPETLNNIDIGLGRRIAQFNNDIPNKNNVLTIVKRCLSIKNGNTIGLASGGKTYYDISELTDNVEIDKRRVVSRNSSRTLSNSEVIDEYYKHPDFYQWVHHMASQFQSHTRAQIAPTGLAYFLINSYSNELMSMFHEMIVDDTDTQSLSLRWVYQKFAIKAHRSQDTTIFILRAFDKFESDEITAGFLARPGDLRATEKKWNKLISTGAISFDYVNKG